MSSSASSQHYSLKWNNHQTHVLSAFDALLQNEFLVDCTLVCEDTSVKAHKVVLSACSPYFQKIFTDNPCKHPVIVLKDVRGWEVNCIVDFMYKGETSVPEAQLTSLIKAAESLKVRGLTSSDSRLSVEPTNDHMRGYFDHKSNQSSPISLTNHDDRSSARPSSPAGHGSAGPPRRKQARPRRRSGDSIGNSSLDLSKADSPNTFRKSPKMDDEMAPENLSMKRPSSSPAINLVKTESLLESGGRTSAPVDNCSERDSSSEKGTPPTTDPFHPLDKPHFLGNGIGHHGIQEQEARVEALQALNFMAAGGGLPHFPPPPGHLPHLPPHGPHHLPPSMMGRPTSTPNTPTPSAYTGKPRGPKGQHSAPRGGPPRSWTNDDLTKALENVWNKRMTTSQASRVFGIPYNSLLMYVRGKYGKSLKLDVLKKQTPAANDNLNTIGNSRSTPKEKQLAEKTKMADKKLSPQRPFFNPLQEQLGLLGMFPADPRIKELMHNLQSNQHAAFAAAAAAAAGQHAADRLKEFASNMDPATRSELFDRMSNPSPTPTDRYLLQPDNSQSPSLFLETAKSPVALSEQSLSSPDHEKKEDDLEMAEKERQVQAMLVEATKHKEDKENEEMDTNELKINVPSEISA